MNIYRLLVGLTVLNLVLLVLLLAQMRPTAAQEVAPVLRGRALQIVDERGNVRASIAVLPATTQKDGERSAETVLLRLITEKGRPSLKIAASEESTGIALIGPSSTKNTYVQLGSKGTISSLTLKMRTGESRTSDRRRGRIDSRRQRWNTNALLQKPRRIRPIRGTSNFSVSGREDRSKSAMNLAGLNLMECARSKQFHHINRSCTTYNAGDLSITCGFGEIVAIEVQVDGAQATLRLSGGRNAGEDLGTLMRTVDDLLSQGYREFVLDLREVWSIESAGLGEIVRAYRTVTRRGGRFSFHGLHENKLKGMKLFSLFKKIGRRDPGESDEIQPPLSSFNPLEPRLTDGARSPVFLTAVLTLLVIVVLALWRLWGVF